MIQSVEQGEKGFLQNGQSCNDMLDNSKWVTYM